MISASYRIVGRDDDEKPISASLPALYVKNQDPEWYAEQAARLRDELEYRQAQLRDYQQALDDARKPWDVNGRHKSWSKRTLPPLPKPALKSCSSA